MKQLVWKYLILKACPQAQDHLQFFEDRYKEKIKSAAFVSKMPEKRVKFKALS